PAGQGNAIVVRPGHGDAHHREDLCLRQRPERRQDRPGEAGSQTRILAVGAGDREIAVHSRMVTGTALALTALLSSGALAPPPFPADSPAIRLTLAQVKGRLAAGTEEAPPDLARTDISGLDLSGIDFKRANLA